MTASPGREVDANLLSGAAPGSAQPRAGSDDAGGEDLGDLVEALGRSHEVWVEGVGQRCACLRSGFPHCCQDNRLAKEKTAISIA
jgi:hypothetical protein